MVCFCEFPDCNGASRSLLRSRSRRPKAVSKSPSSSVCFAERRSFSVELISRYASLFVAECGAFTGAEPPNLSLATVSLTSFAVTFLSPALMMTSRQTARTSSAFNPSNGLTCAGGVIVRRPAGELDDVARDEGTVVERLRDRFDVSRLDTRRQRVEVRHDNAGHGTSTERRDDPRPDGREWPVQGHRVGKEVQRRYGDCDSDVRHVSPRLSRLPRAAS